VTAIFKKSGEFTDAKRRDVAPSNSKAPHIYVFAKIYKTNFPFRPIVSSIDSPFQKLVRYLEPILNPLVGKTSTYIKKRTGFHRKNIGNFIN
jgi:hypothetical protein